MFFNRKKTRLTALQIEVTSRCTRSCSICPRHVLSDQWAEGDLSKQIWERIKPELGLAEHIHLQGWGEPLLHPNLPQMIRDVKHAGVRVGLTTNGDLLEPATSWIIDEGVDQVAVSIAGDSANHANFRDRSNLDRIFDSIGKLAEENQQKKGSTFIQIAYLLTHKNSPDLPKIITRAAKCGVNEVYVIHLDVTPDFSVFKQAAFGADGLRDGVSKWLDISENNAKSLGIVYRGPARTPEELLVCASNPPNIAVIGWDGSVGPCVNLVLPVQGPIPRWTENRKVLVDPIYFGNLINQTLEEILDSPKRSRFNGSFFKRLQSEQEFLATFSNVSAFEAYRRINNADKKRIKDLEKSPFPLSCIGCHKQFGW